MLLDFYLNAVVVLCAALVALIVFVFFVAWLVGIDHKRIVDAGTASFLRKRKIENDLVAVAAKFAVADKIIAASQAGPYLTRGERVRILCAIPERGIQPGALGTVKFVYFGDDIEWWVSIDGVEGPAVPFTEERDDWLLERVAA
jgi:hypothetical protein